jgi:hypothetical protein
MSMSMIWSLFYSPKARAAKPKFKGICFNCSKPGHMQAECRQPKRRTYARTTYKSEEGTDERETLVEWSKPEPYNPVQTALRTISILSDEEKQTLIGHINGAGEQDFQTT